MTSIPDFFKLRRHREKSGDLPPTIKYLRFTSCQEHYIVPATSTDTTSGQAQAACQFSTRVFVLVHIVRILPWLGGGQPRFVEVDMSFSLERKCALRLLLGAVLVQFLIQLGCLILDVLAFLFYSRPKICDDGVVTKLPRVSSVKVSHIAPGGNMSDIVVQSLPHHTWRKHVRYCGTKSPTSHLEETCQILWNKVSHIALGGNMSDIVVHIHN